DSINAGAGDDKIIVNGNGATVTAGEGSDNVNISATVQDVTISDFNEQDVMTISGTFEVGSVRVEDMLLVITDKTGTRKIRLGDFNNATDATVNVGEISTTIANWLTNSGIDLNNVEQTSYAESVGIKNSSAQDTSDASNVSSDADTTTNPDSTNNPAVNVDLANVDTSAAGNVVVDGATVGTLSSTYPNATTFTRNGLTIHLLGFVSNTVGDPGNSSDDSLITPLTLDQLTNDQRTIIAGLFKWWGNECLTLNEDSYGISFNSDTTMIKDIGLYFFDGRGYSTTLAAVWNWQSIYNDGSGDGSTTQLLLSVNMGYYTNIDADDVDGESTSKKASLLDRTLAHEFTHALMAANTRYFQYLPRFIKEGAAELTHGIDDERATNIFKIAYDSEWLDKSLNLTDKDSSSQSTGDAYAGGYMFLRYFTRQAALQTLFDTNEPDTPLLILGTNDADDIYNERNGATVQALGGNDTIENIGANVLIDGGTENDIVDNYGLSATINAGNDDDVITNTSVIKIDSEGNVLGVVNSADNASINGGAGSDTIDNFGAMATINGGAGDDVIRNNGVIAIDENNEYVFAVSSEVSINGGAGNDYIKNENDAATLSGGADNDTIDNVDGANVLFEYTAGDGNDVIYGFNETSTLKIGGGSGTYFAEVIDNDIILTVGTGKITLSSAAFLSTINIEGVEAADDPLLIVGTAGADSIINEREGVTIRALGGNDTITNIGDKVFVDGGAGDDDIDNQSFYATINGGEGSDTIRNISDSVKVDGGADNDLITNYGLVVTIDGGKGDDSISLNSTGVLVRYTAGD
ncbi:MAG: hypothetical protein J5497_08210, partial [Selenomonadaceae bacterium]|nr:hypothetical protein [Selenomonadaceae bacterium]